MTFWCGFGSPDPYIATNGSISFLQYLPNFKEVNKNNPYFIQTRVATEDMYVNIVGIAIISNDKNLECTLLHLASVELCLLQFMKFI